MEPEQIPDEELEKLARDVAEALGSALRTSDKEWKIPFLPLTIGLDRLEGKRHHWRSWDIRFTWLLEDSGTQRAIHSSVRGAPIQLNEEEIHELATGLTEALREPLMQTYNDRYILPFLPLLVGTSRQKGHVNKKRWWSWEIRLTWVLPE